MLSSGCDVHECRVPLPKGVRIGRARHMSSWGIRMELILIALRAPCHPGEGSLHLEHADGPPWQNSSFQPGKNSIQPTFHLLRIFHIRNSVRRHFTSEILCADISYPEFLALTFHIRNSVHRHFTSEYLTAGWERRMLQLLRIDIFEPSDNAYQESFSLSIQCHSVLLKLPNISDQHLEIFWFRYLLSKSPNSPCNPPIIGFLSL